MKINSFLIVISLVLLSCQGTEAQQINTIDKEGVKKQVLGKEVQLIDVRTPREYAAGHIDDAVNYNIANKDTFLMQIQKLDKNKPVYVYCKIGGRSSKAAKLFKEKGFTTIYDYSGGYSDWVKQ